MAIKAVSKERIDKALLEFDRKCRSQSEWQGWESNLAHRYAVHVGGELYPAKKIVSLATGIPVGEFSGGRPTNSFLEKRGFTIVELPRGRVSQSYSSRRELYTTAKLRSTDCSAEASRAGLQRPLLTPRFFCLQAIAASNTGMPTTGKGALTFTRVRGNAGQ